MFHSLYLCSSTPAWNLLAGCRGRSAQTIPYQDTIPSSAASIFDVRRERQHFQSCKRGTVYTGRAWGDGGIVRELRSQWGYCTQATNTGEGGCIVHSYLILHGMLKTTAFVALFAILGFMAQCIWHTTFAEAQLATRICPWVSELIPEKNYEF